MQRNSHERARFFVNARGVLIDRQAAGSARRTGYSMDSHRATRSEMQILADLLNEPAQMAEWDAGGKPDMNWERRRSLHEQDWKRGICAVAASSGAWARFTA